MHSLLKKTIRLRLIPSTVLGLRREWWTATETQAYLIAVAALRMQEWFVKVENAPCSKATPVNDDILIEQGTERANCSTGSIRLANATVTADTVEGRVEVCINQAWGTVCSNRFDQEDAGTVCVVAGGFLRNGM